MSWLSKRFSVMISLSWAHSSGCSTRMRSATGLTVGKCVSIKSSFFSFLLGFQLYIDYIDCITRIPQLTASSHDAVLDAVEASELERLTATVPRLIQLLPANLSDRENWRHNVCVARMLSKLLELQLPIVCSLNPSVRASRQLISSL